MFLPRDYYSAALTIVLTLCVTVLATATQDSPPKRGGTQVKDGGTRADASGGKGEPARDRTKPITDKTPSAPNSPARDARATEAQELELIQRSLKAQAAAAKAEAEAEAYWESVDPRTRNLIDPEITPAEYLQLEAYFKAHPQEVLDSLEKALRDGVVRRWEFEAIQLRWELVAKPQAQTRIRSRVIELQNSLK